jgi:thiol-disulfide isomerase/thioredoxin
MTMRRLLVCLFLFGTSGFLGGTAWADGVSVGSRAPELDAKVQDGKGKKFRLKALRGGWVVVTFGASWCKPCKAELPAWDKLAPSYAGRVTFVAVNIDNDRKKGEKFVKKLKIRNLRVVYSPENKTTSADSYVGGEDPKFPTTFVIDPKGVVRHVQKEYHPGDSDVLARKLDELLK